MEFFATISAKSSILDVWQCSECALETLIFWKLGFTYKQKYVWEEKRRSVWPALISQWLSFMVTYKYFLFRCTENGGFVVTAWLYLLSKLILLYRDLFRTLPNIYHTFIMEAALFFLSYLYYGNCIVSI